MKNLFLSLLFLLLLPSQGWATMYCVKPDGTCTAANKANAVVLSAAACSAVSAVGNALSMAQANAAAFSAGDIIYYSGKNANGGADANYAAGSQLAPGINGTSHIGISDNSGGTAPTVPRGAANRALYLTSGKDAITISNFIFTGSSTSVIQLLDATNIVLSNITAQASAAGSNYIIYVYGSSVTATDVIADSNSQNATPWTIANGTGISTATLTNCKAYGSATGNGFSQTGGSTLNCTLCESYNNGKDGFSSNNTGSVTLTRCLAYSNGSAGDASSGDGYTAHDTSTLNVYYSIGYNNWKSCIAVTGASTGSLLNNSCYNNYDATVEDDYGIWINSSADWVIKNNITANHRSEIYITALATGTLEIDNNLYYDSRGGNAFYWQTEAKNYAGWVAASGETGSVNADPLFVSTVTPDFHLQSSSPAINAGVNICTGVDTPLTGCTGAGTGSYTDYAGMTVPIGDAPEIGAYEYKGASFGTPGIVGPLDSTFPVFKPLGPIKLFKW